MTRPIRYLQLTHTVGNVMVMMDNLPTGRIAPALKFLAIEAKLSQDKLAKKAKMSQSAVNRRLSGSTSLTIDDLERLADALGYRVTVSFEEAA